MDKDWQPVNTELETDQALQCFYRAAIVNDLPIAIWRFPHRSEKQAMIDFSGKIKLVEIDFQGLPTGFLIVPFHSARRHICNYVRADILLEGSKYLIRESSAREHPAVQANRARVEKILLQYGGAKGNSKNRNQRFWFEGSGEASGGKSPGKEEYCTLVKKSLADITAGKLEKVVLSRAIEVDLQKSFDPLLLFNTLCDVYSNAFVSLIALPGIGTWLGATPELLFRLSDNSLTTAALAGTRPVSSKNQSWQGKWGEKEIVEQAIVSEFIRRCFAEHGISDFSEERTESVRIGDLLHLQTLFSLQNVASHGSNIPEKLLRALHPTPAVCGVPQREAMAFIEKEEAHDRGFYAGYLGPVNLADETCLYVNLRCMQLRTNTAILYAGGGITIDSDPEQEWLETELKFDALRKFLSSDIYEEAFLEGGAASKVLCYD